MGCLKMTSNGTDTFNTDATRTLFLLSTFAVSAGFAGYHIWRWLSASSANVQERSDCGQVLAFK